MKQFKLPKAITNALAKLAIIGRHHYFISIVVLLVGLTVAVYVVNQTLSATTDQDYYQKRLSDSLKSSFDKTTISKIQDLQKSSEHSTLPPPTPTGARTNPFAE